VPIRESAVLHGHRKDARATLVRIRERGEWHLFTTR
jgi:hypothetical protein